MTRQRADPALSISSPLGLSRHLPPASLVHSHCHAQSCRSVFLPSITFVSPHESAYKPPCRPGGRYRSRRCSSRVHPRYRRGVLEVPPPMQRKRQLVSLVWMRHMRCTLNLGCGGNRSWGSVGLGEALRPCASRTPQLRGSQRSSPYDPPQVF